IAGWWRRRAGAPGRGRATGKGAPPLIRRRGGAVEPSMVTLVRRPLLAALLLLLASAPLRAHDFWLEPSSYRPAPSQRIAVRARAGMGSLGAPVPADEDRLPRFVAVGSEGEPPVPGISGFDPAGIAQARGSGTLVIAYQSRGSLAELPPEKTALYVQQEGLDS